MGNVQADGHGSIEMQHDFTKHRKLYVLISAQDSTRLISVMVFFPDNVRL